MFQKKKKLVIHFMNELIIYHNYVQIRRHFMIYEAVIRSAFCFCNGGTLSITELITWKQMKCTESVLYHRIIMRALSHTRRSGSPIHSHCLARHRRIESCKPGRVYNYYLTAGIKVTTRDWSILVSASGILAYWHFFWCPMSVGSAKDAQHL